MEIKKRKVGLITFGFSLILIGAAYIFNQYTDLNLFKDLYLLWPLFLIMLGIEFIITKFIYDRKDEEVRLTPSILSIFLIVIILGVTTVWQHIPELQSIPNYLTKSDYYSHTVTQSYSSGPVELNNVQNITVSNTMGRVDIKTSDDNNLSVKAKIEVRSNDEERARDYIIDAIKITKGTNTIIETKRMYDESRIIGSITVDYTILLPKDIDLKVENNFGTVTITGVKGDVSVENTNGPTWVTDIEGDVNADNSFGKITIDRINGEVEARNKSGEIDVSGISSKTTLTTSFGQIEAQHINGDLTVETKNGQVEAEDIQGNTRLTTTFGSISGTNIRGDVAASNSNGDIDLDTITGDIDANTSFGSITWITMNIENASIDAKTRFGDINGSDFNLSVEKDATTAKLSRTAVSEQQKVQLKTNNGSITIKK